MATQISETRERPAEQPYSYEHMRRKTLMEDMSFRKDAPGAGEPMPRFELQTADGGRFSSEDMVGRKPLLLITGSLTCPMTASSNPILKQLHSEFGSKIEFVMLHVREAHPGEKKDQPDSMDEKIAHARELKERDQIPFTIAVDDPSGSVHRQLDEKPNSAWLADRQGTLVYRSLWAGDEAGLRRALEAVASGKKPEQKESTKRVVPMAMGVGMMQEMIRRSGPRAQRDIVRAAPPMAALAWVADKFSPLSPKWRGLLAMGALGGVATAAVAGIARAVRR